MIWLAFPELVKIVQDNILYSKSVELMDDRANAAKLDFSEVYYRVMFILFNYNHWTLSSFALNLYYVLSKRFLFINFLVHFYEINTLRECGGSSLPKITRMGKWSIYQVHCRAL